MSAFVDAGKLAAGAHGGLACVDCHGDLAGQGDGHGDDAAPVDCASCHEDQLAAATRGVHARESGGRPAAACADCHRPHELRRGAEALTSCSNCNAGVVELQRASLHGRSETFFDTFHGKVSRLGTEGAAKCSDCHGSHTILPPTDPASTLSRANVVETCAQCHPGSNRQFAGYLTHATHHDKDHWPWLYWSFRFITLLLVGTLTFALLHTGAWLARLWLSRDHWRHVKALRELEGDARLYWRFTRFQRMQHLTMLLSFFTLAITGMVLKFSYAQWAQWLSRLLGGQPTMAVMHRFAAIILIGVFTMHVQGVRRQRNESGQTWLQLLTGPDTILFARRDLTDLVTSIKWFLGLEPRPSYGRYTYWKKFDYFAVSWNVMVIGSTGFVLWFPELLTRVLPGWSINVATIVHSDEALFAVGFIFTIHFFNTHFRPDKFRMDSVIFTGRMPLGELQHGKPDEYAQMVREGKLEEHLVAPMPRPVERSFKIFGFVALGIGLMLIGLIVYAMFFAYR